MTTQPSGRFRLKPLTYRGNHSSKRTMLTQDKFSDLILTLYFLEVEELRLGYTLLLTLFRN